MFKKEFFSVKLFAMTLGTIEIFFLCFAQFSCMKPNKNMSHPGFPCYLCLPIGIAILDKEEESFISPQKEEAPC